MSFPVHQVRYNDVSLYQERTNPKGPAMTHSMFAIGWLELGEKEKAAKPFFKNYDNMQGPFKVSRLSINALSVMPRQLN
mgnify:CR=1 FL=1